MNPTRIDQLARELAASRSRRDFMRTMAGATAALAGSVIATRPAGAARRPAPTPTPTPVPNACAGIPCGSDCCEPGISECCDGACCFGECYAEELCCPTGLVVCDGVCCGAGEFCIEGACIGCAGCYIGGVCHAASELNPSNLCQRCEPTVSRSTWTDINITCPILNLGCTGQTGMCDPATGQCEVKDINEGGVCGGIGLDQCKNSSGTCVAGKCVVGPDSLNNGKVCGFASDHCWDMRCLDGACVQAPRNEGDGCGVSDNACRPNVCANGVCVETVATNGKRCGQSAYCMEHVCLDGTCQQRPIVCDDRFYCDPSSSANICISASSGVVQCVDNSHCTWPSVCAAENPCNPVGVAFYCYIPEDIPTCGV